MFDKNNKTPGEEQRHPTIHGGVQHIQEVGKIKEILNVAFVKFASKKGHGRLIIYRYHLKIKDKGFLVI